MTVKEEALKKIMERCCVLFGKKMDELDRVFIELDENTRFIDDLGAKSGNVSQMTNFLEDEFDVEISFMEFRRKATLGMAAEYIEELCEE